MPRVNEADWKPLGKTVILARSRCRWTAMTASRS